MFIKTDEFQITSDPDALHDQKPLSFIKFLCFMLRITKFSVFLNTYIKIAGTPMSIEPRLGLSRSTI